MRVVKLPQDGGCACGAARVRLSGAPLLVYACHCHDCQSRSGSAFTLSMVVRSADLAVEGRFDTLVRNRTGGRRTRQTRCAACGAPLFALDLGAPDYATLLAGVLDDASWVRPATQTFVESAIPWAVIPDVPAVAWADFDFIAQGQAWATSAPRFEG